MKLRIRSGLNVVIGLARSITIVLGTITFVVIGFVATSMGIIVVRITIVVVMVSPVIGTTVAPCVGATMNRTGIIIASSGGIVVISLVVITVVARLIGSIARGRVAIITIVVAGAVSIVVARMVLVVVVAIAIAIVITIVPVTVVLVSIGVVVVVVFEILESVEVVANTGSVGVFESAARQAEFLSVASWVSEEEDAFQLVIVDRMRCDSARKESGKADESAKTSKELRWSHVKGFLDASKFVDLFVEADRRENLSAPSRHGDVEIG